MYSIQTDVSFSLSTGVVQRSRPRDSGWNAQCEPEKYRDLVVKVAGYHACFVDLHKEVQDSIIDRTEHGI